MSLAVGAMRAYDSMRIEIMRHTIGLIMAWLFRQEEAERAAKMADTGLFDQKTAVPRAVWSVFLLLIAVLIVGTLQVELLTGAWFTLYLPLQLPAGLLLVLDGLSLAPQGALLIVMLVLIAPMAYLGLENVLEHFNRWTYATMGLVALTLLMAAPTFAQGSVIVGVTGRFVAELVLIATIGAVAVRSFDQQQIAEWLWETWRFVKQIFPLLIAGVFLAGMVRVILPEQWIQSLAGRNTLGANFIGVVFGVFMYFPTLVEVPIARIFLDLGMHRGPLLAYLLADPELSPQSILVTSKIMGRRKTAAYVTLVAMFSTLAGYLFGLLLAAI